MTREVARREIESLDYYLQNHTDDYSEESHTAMMMAISALSAENKADFPHNKLIRDATSEEICCFCGGVKRFGICQDCGSSM